MAKSESARTVGSMNFGSKKARGRARSGKLAVRALLAVLVSVMIAPLAVVGLDRSWEGRVTTNNSSEVYGPNEAAAYYSGMPRDEEPLPPADGEEFVEIEHVMPTSDRAAWEGEIRIRETSREQMHGRGPSVRKPVEYTYRPERKRILLIGDSYIYGYSHEVKENVFDRQLEQLLQRANNGAYEVVTLATDQSSFLRQSDWVTPEKLAVIDPDIVILTNTMGRLQPTFMEQKYCRQFNTCVEDGQLRPMEDATGHTLDRANDKWRIMLCLRADDGLVSKLFRNVLYPYLPNIGEYLAMRYCTKERILKGVDVPTERSAFEGDYEQHPFIGDLDEALSRIRRSVDGLDKPVATYMLNLPWEPRQLSKPTIVNGHSNPPALGPIFDRFEKYGFEEIPRPLADEVMISRELWKANDVQGDSKGTTRNRCVYDCQVSEQQWRANLRMYTEGLIAHPMKYRQGNVMQYAIAKDLTAFLLERHPVTAPQGLGPSQPLVLEYTPAFLALGANSSDYATVHHYRNNRLLGRSLGYDWNGVWLAASCARMGAPHAVVALNGNNFAAGDQLKVGYHRGTRDDLVLMFERRDEVGNLVPVRTVRLSQGSSYTLSDTDGISNVYIADTTVGCGDKEVVLEPFEISFQLLRD